MTSKATGRTQGAGFTIQAPFDGEPDKPIAAVAYLFDRSGALLASEALSDGRAQFSLRQAPAGARLLIGPALDEGRRAAAPTRAMLERLNAYAPAWRFEAGRRVYEIEPIPDHLWRLWFWCRCRVRGRVIKRVALPGGGTLELPVCKARVHICEVDRLWWVIERLPDPDIFRLRDDLLRLIRQPFPWPPEPDPNPFGADRITPDALERRARVAAAGAMLRVGREVALNPQPLPPIDLPQALASQSMAPAMQFALASQSAQVLRRGLLDNIDLIRPWICHWPWLHPWYYWCDELRTIITDDDGRFDTSIFYPCFGDKPDLYFWVEYSIGGVWTTVYRPPIPCNIWWDYPCGTEVTITITDPRVHGCSHSDPLPGKKVVVKTIGRQVSMGEIQRAAAGAARQGTVQPGWHHPTRESPFGATLDPRVDFGDGLKPAGITHYRWSYRPLGSTGAWTVIDAPVSRHYREATAPGMPVIYKPKVIGPAEGIEDYYVEIDPALPAGGEDWEVLDEVFDLASAYWNTTPLAAGKYELSLELFRKTGATMTRVDLGAEGVEVYEVVSPAPLTSGTYVTQPATLDRALMDGGSLVGYRLVLHTDNRPCFGTIDTVTVAPGEEDQDCGFLEYAPGAKATIRFRASHPADYARFDFDVTRVTTELAAAHADGLVDDAIAFGYIRTGDQFAKDVAVTDLLAGTACIRAAFAELLDIKALATNGYDRLSGLDAPRGGHLVPPQYSLRAFAITPLEP
ncbi:MAG TPA: hypothetical protein VGW40_11085 [Allosphingosinicella sp.]|nr:hypothetical protein [Allosphingosinicella sp.]